MKKQNKIAIISIIYYLPIAILIIAIFVYFWQRQEYEHRNLFTLTYKDNRLNVKCTVNGIYYNGTYYSDVMNSLESPTHIYARIKVNSNLDYPVLYSNSNLFLSNDDDTIYVTKGITQFLDKPHPLEYHALDNSWDSFHENVIFDFYEYIPFEDLKKIKLGYNYVKDSIKIGLITRENIRNNNE